MSALFQVGASVGLVVVRFAGQLVDLLVGQSDAERFAAGFNSFHPHPVGEFGRSGAAQAFVDALLHEFARRLAQLVVGEGAAPTGDGDVGGTLYGEVVSGGVRGGAFFGQQGDVARFQSRIARHPNAFVGVGVRIGEEVEQFGVEFRADVRSGVPGHVRFVRQQNGVGLEAGSFGAGASDEVNGNGEIHRVAWVGRLGVLRYGGLAKCGKGTRDFLEQSRFFAVPRRLRRRLFQIKKVLQTTGLKHPF